MAGTEEGLVAVAEWIEAVDVVAGAAAVAGAGEVPAVRADGGGSPVEARLRAPSPHTQQIRQQQQQPRTDLCTETLRLGQTSREQAGDYQIEDGLSGTDVESREKIAAHCRAHCH